MNAELATTYEASLKSIETENYLDRVFFRPVGFFIAKRLCKTAVSPNMITIISIFIGSAAGPLFYHTSIFYLIPGMICLIMANILDCVDGQLARLTGKKSKIGRILDGLAGIIWFTLIYVYFAFYEKIYLVTTYAKAEMGDLSQAEKRELKKLVKAIESELKKKERQVKKMSELFESIRQGLSEAIEYERGNLSARVDKIQ